MTWTTDHSHGFLQTGLQNLFVKSVHVIPISRTLLGKNQTLQQFSFSAVTKKKENPNERKSNKSKTL